MAALQDVYTRTVLSLVVQFIQEGGTRLSGISGPGRLPLRHLPEGLREGGAGEEFQ